MDFKSLMAAQIAKSKPSTSTSSSSTSATSKYQKRGEIEAQRQAAYVAEQARLEREREERQARKRKLEEEEAEQNAVREIKKQKLAEESRMRREAEEAEQERLRRKRLGLPEVPEGLDKDEQDRGPSTPLPNDLPDIEETDLQSKLRQLNHPAVLFEESHTSRLKRYYDLTATLKSKPKRSQGPIPTTLESVPGKDLLLPAIKTSIPAASNKDEYAFIHRQIASYFTLLLTEWSLSLASRPASVQSSQSGQAAAKTYHLVIADLTPLYRKLESQTLVSSLLTPLVEITSLIQQRKYVSANDTYLRLSIGKAAWPIGVTMVGIHERSAREKLHSDSKGGDKEAHIMSDEVTRKILQSIKRCISFAQVRWPPDDVGQLMG